MPLHPAEEETIRAFVLREKRQRILYLLTDPKHRKKGLDWLNHFAAWDPRYESPIDSAARPGLANLLRAAGAAEICHLISDSRELDGRDLPLDEAVERAGDFDFASLLCCIPGQLALHFDESWSPRRLVLLQRPIRNQSAPAAAPNT